MFQFDPVILHRADLPVQIRDQLLLFLGVPAIRMHQFSQQPQLLLFA